MVILKDINLIPKHSISKREQEDLLKTLIGVIIATLVLALLVDFGAWYLKINYESKIAKQTAEINKLLESETDLASLEVIKQKLKYREDILNKVDAKRLEITNFLDKLSILTPKEVYIIKLDVNSKDEVTLEGQSSKEEAVLDFYHSLKANNIGDYINFNTMSGTLGEGEFKFAYKFKLLSGK